MTARVLSRLAALALLALCIASVISYGRGSAAADPPAVPPLLPAPAPAPAPVQPDPQPPQQQPAGPGHPAPAKPALVRLSNEKTLTRWAHTRRVVSVRRSPSAHSKKVARLRNWTEDGAPEIYLALNSLVDARGAEWVQIALPMRPNGTRGWVPRRALGGFHVVTTQLVVDRRRLTAVLYRAGRVVWHAPVGVGKHSTPTPAGLFWIRELLRSPNGNSIYGPWAFGTSAYSVLTDWPGGGVVGIHGTDQPQLIPGRPSHGCIRVRNGPITRLARLMPLGTPVLVR